MAKTTFTSPVMRFVQGSVDVAQDKDMQGNPRVIKSGPNAGQPNPQYFVAGAVAKTDPAWPAFWELLVRQAFADFPNLFPHGADAIIQAGGPQPWFNQVPQGHQMPWVLGDFSWKITDGDSTVFREGKAINYADREGFAGCWVVRFGSAYPPRCFHAGRYAASEQIQEKNVIRRGYYIRISGSTDGNGNAQKPGLYINLDLVELSGYAPEIVSGPDASAAFGGAPVTLPPGATAAPATPPAGAPPVPPTPGAPAAPTAPASPAPSAVSPSPTPPPPTVQPYTGFMPPAGAPAAAPAIPTPAPAPPPAPIASPSSPVMLPAAQGATYEQMVAVGWTDETLRANGMMQ
mgnify:CR=1 FL=1